MMNDTNLWSDIREKYVIYEEEYKQAAENYQHIKQEDESKLDNLAYEIKYSEHTRKILINNFLLKQLRSFSDNDAIFAYLYKNPNQEKTDEDIKRDAGLETVKDFNKFLDDLGFTGNLRKVFFKVSKSKIRFNNPITKEYLQEVGIDRLKLG